MKHKLKREYVGKAEMGSITPTCSCGWRGRTEYAYNDYCYTNVGEQESDHTLEVIVSHRPSAELARKRFEELCDLLPGDVNWYDPITPNIVREIVIAIEERERGALEKLCNAALYTDRPSADSVWMAEELKRAIQMRSNDGLAPIFVEE